ncbi:MAG TPA: VOC family protein [Caulobacteraceae bacterium]|jgi:predicted lactoylglutathione lyase|nr:VOC family protein [Caulobacteraceae bacterium]
MDLGWLEVSFDVKDVQATRAFYEKLGFQLVSTADKGMSAVLQGGNCRLALYQGVLGPAESQLIFWQGEVERCAEVLADAGATIVRPLEVNEKGAAVTFRDPDGQVIFVISEPGETQVMPPEADGDLDRGVFQVSLPVKDLATTTAFYKRLGFRSADSKPEDRVLAMSNGRDRICLYQGHLDPEELQLIFWQGDIDAVADTARREGFGFLREPGRDERGAGCMLKDPDGRPLFFITMGKYEKADFAV